MIRYYRTLFYPILALDGTVFVKPRMDVKDRVSQCTRRNHVRYRPAKIRC